MIIVCSGGLTLLRVVCNCSWYAPHLIYDTFFHTCFRTLVSVPWIINHSFTHGGGYGGGYGDPWMDILFPIQV